jgi:hypothetical protein
VLCASAVVVLAGAGLAARSQTVFERPPSDVSVSDPRSTEGLRITAFTVSTLGSAASHSVLMGVEVQGLAGGVATSSGEPRRLEVDFVAEGGPATSRLTVPLVDAEAGRRAAEQGVRVLTRMTLGVGRHTLRVMVRDTGDRRSASMIREFEVLNLLAGSLTMGELALSASGVGGLTHPEPEEDSLFPLVGKPPTGRRTFSRDEKLEVNAEIYEAPVDDGFGGQLTIATSLLASDGRVVYEAVDLGSSETLPSGVFGYQHYTLVPIVAVPPGDYTIRVTAAIDGDNSASTWRAVPITIQ